jgi:NAD(P)-dependent dehydrogenase (short-subunit alcohol dehydrogenase family)
MADKTIVFITDGNTGIGYETVKALYASPQAHTILMGSRSLDKTVEAISTLKSEVPETNSEVIPSQIDIEDNASIEKAFAEVSSKYHRIDALVNNAGKSHIILPFPIQLTYSGAAFDTLMRNDPSIPTMRKAWAHAYSLNATSTQVFTHTFMSLLLASPPRVSSSSPPASAP